MSVWVHEFGDSWLYPGCEVGTEEFTWRGEYKLAVFAYRPSGKELLAVMRSGSRKPPKR